MFFFSFSAVFDVETARDLFFEVLLLPFRFLSDLHNETHACPDLEISSRGRRINRSKNDIRSFFSNYEGPDFSATAISGHCRDETTLLFSGLCMLLESTHSRVFRNCLRK